MTLFRSILVFAVAYLLTACGTRPPLLPVEPVQPPLEPETPAQPAQPANFAEWQQAFARRAAAAGIADSDIRQLLARTHYEEKVVSADRKQPELNKMVWAYLDNAVSDDRIRKGRAQLARYRDLLQQIEAQTGVGAAYIVAFWGMESAYGENTGNVDLIQALSTLAYEGRRRDFAEQQLIALLQLIERGDVGWDELRGSWAGGMGHTQFIPTTFLQYSVDGNGDGRRDPWQIEDALASTANYLSQSGWQRGQRWGREVSLPAAFDYRDIDQTLPLAQWGQRGVRQVSGAALPQENLHATLWLPAGHSGPALLLYPNFKTIKVYNNSSSYALAIGLLADGIGGSGGGIRAAWPRDEQALSRDDVQRLQQALTAAGYDTKGTDGILGANTRSAFRQWQAASGQIPDGFISQRSAAVLIGGY
ncbi:lytic murein transglycosylase [uncultured Cardiobacterium sp.]|uniref:lytic murein transglycosylase n=1 Tax=uncultured Cardiobacterium sp. TaxID=417619 RepID=UPI0026115A7C|nr:lytic murein transglycosylase [uncultured Cardiobacterium sp.]